MALIEKRYAKAFFDLAVQNNAIDEYQEELVMITKILQNDTSFESFLFTPKNDILKKKHLLTDVFKGRVNKNTLNFLLLLLDKDRIKFLPAICKEFIVMSDEFKSILNISIFTATDLTKKDINDICNSFKKLYNAKSVKAEVEIDKTLIGGIKVAVGDKVYDGTIKGKLSGLQSVLTK